MDIVNMFSSNLLRIVFITWATWLMVGCSGLEIPKLESVTATNEGGIFVTWKPINSSLSETILGYKLIIYEVKEKEAKMFKLVNADQQPGFVEEYRPDEVFGTIPLRLAKQILAEGADTENIVIDYIKPNSLQEIRILAYTKDKESKMSEPWRVKVFKDSKIKGVAHRYLDQCVLTIRTYDSPTDSPEIYNNYI